MSDTVIAIMVYVYLVVWFLIFIVSYTKLEPATDTWTALIVGFELALLWPLIFILSLLGLIVVIITESFSFIIQEVKGIFSDV